MTWIGAIVLAVVAGVTEILPVSGSGHLYIFEKLMGLELSQADFMAYRGILHLGIGAALLLFYHKRMGQMLRELLMLIAGGRPNPRKRTVSFPRRLFFLLLLSALPMFLSLFLNGLRVRIENSDSVLLFVSGFLLLSGIVLYLTGRSARERKNLQQLTLPDALVMGLFQVPTVFPGLSRSGMLLSAGLLREASCGSAVEFAGLMGIPVFLVSGLVQWFGARKTGAATIPTGMCVVGLIITVLVGLMTLRFLRDRAAVRKPTGFAYWCWGAGLLALVLFLVAA